MLNSLWNWIIYNFSFIFFLNLQSCATAILQYHKINLSIVHIRFPLSNMLYVFSFYLYTTFSDCPSFCKFNFLPFYLMAVWNTNRTEIIKQNSVKTRKVGWGGKRLTSLILYSKTLGQKLQTRKTENLHQTILLNRPSIFQRSLHFSSYANPFTILVSFHLIIYDHI